MGTRPIFLMTAVALATQACGGAPPARPPAPTTERAQPAPTTLAEALSAVAKRRAHVDALTAPAYSGPRDEASLTQFMNTRFRDWMARKDRALQEASRAYQAAIAVALPEQAATLRLAFAEMWLAYSAEFLQGAKSAIPDSWQRQPHWITAYEQELQATAAPAIELARSALERCVSAAAKTGAWSDTTQACEQKLAQLAQPKQDPLQTRFSPPAYRATTQLAPCVYHGTLYGHGLRFYADKDKQTELGRLETVLATVRLPSEPGKPAELALEWPVQTTAYVEDYAVELTHELDILQERAGSTAAGRLWLPKGAPVAAYKGPPGQARVKRSFKSHAGGAPTPGEISLDVACAALSLRGPLRMGSTDELRTALWLGGEDATLHHCPNGESFAAVQAQGQAVIPLRYQDGWTRVRLYVPFHAEGWVRDSALTERKPQGLAAVGIRSVHQRAITHVVTRRTSLWLAPHPDATLLGELVPGAGVRVGETVGEFVEIYPRAIRREEDRPYYASRDQLSESFSAALE